MKIYMSSPGQFYQGFNSKLRGEGRWLAHLADILTQQGHQVSIFSNDPVKPYQDRGVVFSSIHNQLGDPSCDLLISMDSFPDLPEVFHKTNISPLLGKFKPKLRVWAGYFPLGDYDSPIYDIMPVIHPWNYKQCSEGRANFIPIVTHEQVYPPGFDRNRFHWYSKNAHEEPQYIAGVMAALHKLVTEYGAVGSFVDGIQIDSQPFRKEYPKNKEDMTKILFRDIISRGSESFAYWAPYDHVQQLLSQSKLLVGVHHPVAAPSMAEIAVYGGFPIQWKNQHDCPPYEDVDIPFIEEDASDEEVYEFILEMWNNEELFTKSVLTCQEAISPHSSANVYRVVENFIGSL